jgi:hypothetical protein
MRLQPEDHDHDAADRNAEYTLQCNAERQWGSPALQLVAERR